MSDLVFPHGGPTANDFRRFSPLVQGIVDQGFVSLQPNFRGSTGYGARFRDAYLNDFGGGDLDDIEAGVNFLKSLDYIDSSRIGILGVSYGGYLTYLTLTKKPSLCKVGSAIMGIISLKLLYETCKITFPWFNTWLESYMGIPDNEDTLALWEDRSPINFVNQLTAKIQIIHPVNDPRCPFDQAETFKDRLLTLGKQEGEDFEYIAIEDEEHLTQSTEVMTTMYAKAIEFFKKYL